MGKSIKTYYKKIAACKFYAASTLMQKFPKDLNIYLE
jgi:hypothetical protein